MSFSHLIVEQQGAGFIGCIKPAKSTECFELATAFRVQSGIGPL